MARNIKIHRFNIDKNLAYAIQNITNEPTEEILAYFLGIGTFVGEDAITSKKAIRLKKELILFYKETSIPFKLDIWGSYHDRLQNVDTINASISVKFPVRSRQLDVTELISKVTEIGLGLIESDDSLPKFEKPLLRAPHCLRDIRVKQNDRK